MSCIAVKIEPVNPVPELRATRVSDFKCRFGLICATSAGKWDVLYASDGILLTVDGGVIFVKHR